MSNYGRPPPRIDGMVSLKVWNSLTKMLRAMKKKINRTPINGVALWRIFFVNIFDIFQLVYAFRWIIWRTERHLKILGESLNVVEKLAIFISPETDLPEKVVALPSCGTIIYFNFICPHAHPLHVYFVHSTDSMINAMLRTHLKLWMVVC